MLHLGVDYYPHYNLSAMNSALWKTIPNRVFKRLVIPPKAGIQSVLGSSWIPAYVGMTERETFLKR